VIYTKGVGFDKLWRTAHPWAPVKPERILSKIKQKWLIREEC